MADRVGDNDINRLVGTSDADFFLGLGALDTLVGLGGNDVYLLFDANSGFYDIIDEGIGGGVDSVIITAVVDALTGGSVNRYTLAENVENGTIGGFDTGSGVDIVFTLSGNSIGNVLTGNRTLNTLYGGGGGDTLNGGLGLDTLDGGTGDDVYILLDSIGGTYDNVIEGFGAGADTVLVGAGGTYAMTANVENALVAGIDNGFGADIATNVTGNSIANVITGNRAANTLAGGGGNDILSGGLGLDRLEGGSGDDLYNLLDANFNVFDTVVEGVGGGIDTVIVQYAISIQTIPQPFGPPLQIPTPIVAYELTANVENGTIGGVDTQTGADAFFTLVGNGLANVLTGNRVANTLVGAGGNDTLNGGLGADVLNGGLGDDTYILDDKTLGSGIVAIAAYDTVTEAAGGGTDTVLVRGIDDFTTLGTDSYTLVDNVENGSLVGNSIAFNLEGNELGNTLTGNAGVNTIWGLEGNDVLNGALGFDRLEGGSGDDLYNLLDANFNVFDTVVEEAGGGIDTVIVQYAISIQTIPQPIGPPLQIPTPIVAYELAANVENGTIGGVDTQTGADAFFNLVGNGLANVLTGNRVANTLVGAGGNDTLNGGLGADVLNGGLGDDTYVLEDKTLGSGAAAIAAYDTVTEAAGGGTDTVLVRGIDDLTTVGRDGYTLGANVENGTLIGSSIAFDLTGNAAANVLTGNSSSNTLTGLGGNDTLDGQGGVDTLVGGLNDDLYILGDYSVPFVGGQGAYDTVVEAAGGGIDSLIITALPNNNAITTVNGYTLGAEVENATLVASPIYTIAFNLTGNGLGNTLTGHEQRNTILGLGGNDTLNGGLALDVLDGGTGNDTYILDDMNPGAGGVSSYDTIVEAANGGTDSVLVRGFVANGTFTLATNLENGTLTGNSLTFNLTGNEVANVLTGNNGNNTLTGLGGNDTLDGQVGVDRLSGGLGDDLYILGDYSVPFVGGQGAYDTIVEAAGAGIDSVIVTALPNNNAITTVNGYTLAANVENATVVSSPVYNIAFNLTGNGLANTLVGNETANVINGLEGSDTLLGLGGSDTFRFASALGATNIDILADYNVAQDRIELENAFFAALTTTGALNAAAFASNTTGLATDALDRIIYETDTGKLYYDSNGSVAGGVYQQFAQLAPGLAMAAGEFFVI